MKPRPKDKHAKRQSPSPTRSLPFSPKSFFASLAILLTVWLAYQPASRAGFIWDDDDYVSQNPNLQSASGLSDIWLHPTHNPQYYPLTFTTFWIEHQLWDNDAPKYHTTNILLHALNALLLWRLLHHLKIPGAFIAAAIFALHPVMVESVAWITERKNTLSLFFYLLSLIAWTRSTRPPSDNKPDRQSPTRPYLLSLLFFTLALLSKTVTATLPLAALLILWWQTIPLRRKHILALLPFFVLGIAAALFTSHLERTHVGASGPEFNFTFPQRILIAGHAIWFYAAKFFIPYPLTFIYPKWPINPSSPWPWSFPVAALLTLIILYRWRTRLTRAPFVVAAFFIITLAPALGFANFYPMRYSFVADHFQYHASIALCALAGVALHRFATHHPVARYAPIPLLLTLAILTHQQSQIYSNNQSLWRSVVAHNPASWMAWTNLAHALRPTDRPASSAAYTTALNLAPHIAETHFNAAQLQIDANNFPAALTEIQTALTLNPTYPDALDLKGFILSATNDPQAALQCFQKALQLNPRHRLALFNLARTHKQLNQLDQAIAHFNTALKLYPDDPDALLLLADCHRQQGHLAQAQQTLQSLLNLHPENQAARFNQSQLQRQIEAAQK